MGKSYALLPARALRWTVAVSTFVTVGNGHQPFSRLLKAVAALAPDLPQPVIVQHGYTSFSSAGCEAHSFLEMNSFIAALTAADIVILHAGASALHAIQAGKVPVIVPRRACFDELVDDHQIEFARQLEGMGLAVVVEDVADLARAVEEVRTIRVQALASRPPPLVRMVAEILDRRARDEEYR